VKFKGKDVRLTFTTPSGEKVEVKAVDLEAESIINLDPPPRSPCVHPGCEKERIPWAQGPSGQMYGAAFCLEHMPEIPT
jgi:hypothetical protein